MPANAPKIANAPGLVWRLRKRQQMWTATWQCRSDLAALGYRPNRVPLWEGREIELGLIDQEFIADQCQALQSDMLIFGRGGVPQVSAFDGTLQGLAHCYRTDPDSKYLKHLRHHTRLYYNSLIKRLNAEYGSQHVEDIRARNLLHWHEEWKVKSGVPMAHALITMLRTLIRFGATLLEDKECARLSMILSEMEFEMPKKGRTEVLTADQAIAIRAEAHKRGLHSLALAQAFQFECTFRQKDVIGEWVPIDDPGTSEVISEGFKWLRGLRWSEIDDHMTLRHETSKKSKDIEINLNLAPMVIEEMKQLLGLDRDTALTRDALPASGPIVVAEIAGVPWRNYEFRRHWRKIATALGLPAEVKNRHSRHGAISEATDAGVPIEHVRHAATHSNVATTMIYSGNSAGKIANVMQIRVAHRNKKGTD